MAGMVAEVCNCLTISNMSRQERLETTWAELKMRRKEAIFTLPVFVSCAAIIETSTYS